MRSKSQILSKLRADGHITDEEYKMLEQTGHWINNQNGTYICDACGCKHSWSNFCPNCGAKMEVSE